MEQMFNMLIGHQANVFALLTWTLEGKTDRIIFSEHVSYDFLTVAMNDVKFNVLSHLVDN